MPVLIALSGISGSGKSTYAKAWVAEDPANRVRVNQDEIRAEMFETPDYSEEQEKRVLARNAELIRQYLSQGKSVISDNTNLTVGKLQYLEDTARHFKAEFRLHRLEISMDEAKARIAKRAADGGLMVPDFVLDNQYAAFQKTHASV